MDLPLHPVAASYRELLERLDAWFAAEVRRRPGVVPCRGGCSACCHGPFDISVADALLLREAVARLAPEARAAVLGRARALLAKMEAFDPEAARGDAAALPEERFDALCDALAEEACPLLDERGRCRVYSSRPLVCRLIGLGMVTPAGRVIENACPIRERFPAYDALPPAAFDLEAFEDVEAACLEGAALELLGTPLGRDFETTIARAVAEPDLTAPPPPPPGRRTPPRSGGSPG